MVGSLSRHYSAREKPAHVYGCHKMGCDVIPSDLDEETSRRFIHDGRVVYFVTRNEPPKTLDVSRSGTYQAKIELPDRFLRR